MNHLVGNYNLGMREQWEDELNWSDSRNGWQSPTPIDFWQSLVVPQSWSQFAAAASINEIMVSTAIKDHPEAPRRYLLESELGHIKAKQSRPLPPSGCAWILLGLPAVGTG